MKQIANDFIIDPEKFDGFTIGQEGPEFVIIAYRAQYLLGIYKSHSEEKRNQVWQKLVEAVTTDRDEQTSQQANS